jgi:serine/threonine protein phosphatase PrpC
MEDPEQSESLVAGASLSHKVVNQDAFVCVKNSRRQLSAVIVADGLGSHFGAEIASMTAVQTVADRLSNACSGDEIDVGELFHEAWLRIVDVARQNYSSQTPDPDDKDSFGTTLLCAIETDDAITLGYVGNGAIFHLRGNFNQFPASTVLPWTAMNYLNPHSVPRDGRAAINKLLSLKARPQQTIPSVLRLSKDQEMCGDIILCCTDGIHSYDQAAIGHDDKNEIWVHADPAVPILFASLSAFFEGASNATDLAACLKRYLQQLEARLLVEDDCTTAVLITPKALEYQRAHSKAGVEGALT